MVGEWGGQWGQNPTAITNHFAPSFFPTLNPILSIL